MTDERVRALGHLAVRQHGAFTRQQAAAAGFSRHEIDSRVRRGQWVAIDRGAYRSVETPPTTRQRLLAACLVGPAVASHRSAAALWTLPDADPTIVEVTSVRHRRRWQRDVIWHESVRLDDRDCTVVDRIPVTLPTRTLVDLGAVLDEAALLRALDDALRRKLTSLLRLRAELDSWGDRRRGSGTVRRAIALRIDQPVPESVLESEFDALIRAARLPTPVRQWVVRDDHGRQIARVDFAYPEASLVIEVDGVRYHDGVDDRERDLTRDDTLVGLGLRVQRFRTRDIRQRPAWVIDRVTDALRPRHA